MTTIVEQDEEKIMGVETPFSIFHYKTKKCVIKKLNKISISSDNNEVTTSNQLLITSLSTDSSATIMSNPPLWYQDIQYDDMQKILLNLAKDKSYISLKIDSKIIKARFNSLKCETGEKDDFKTEEYYDYLDIGKIEPDHQITVMVLSINPIETNLEDIKRSLTKKDLIEVVYSNFGNSKDYINNNRNIVNKSLPFIKKAAKIVLGSEDNAENQEWDNFIQDDNGKLLNFSLDLLREYITSKRKNTIKGGYDSSESESDNENNLYDSDSSEEILKNINSKKNKTKQTIDYDSKIETLNKRIIIIKNNMRKSRGRMKEKYRKDALKLIKSRKMYMQQKKKSKMQKKKKKEVQKKGIQKYMKSSSIKKIIKSAVTTIL